MRGKRGPRKLEDKTVPQLHNTLWPIFAAYIKAVHPARCYTCDKALQLGSEDTQAGHWLDRTYAAVKYSEDNVRPQCSRCNKFYSGRPVEFERRLREEINDEAVEALKREATKKWKWSRPDLVEKVKYYRAALKELQG